MSFFTQWTCDDCKNLVESEHRYRAGKTEYKCKKGGWTTKNHPIESYECQNGYHAPDLKSHDVGCYITTIVVNRLGMSDDCDELNTMRKLRSQMQKHGEYKRDLFEYDTVGRALSGIVDKLPIEEVEFINDNYIKGCVKYTKKADEFRKLGKDTLADLYFQKAIIQYRMMTYDLKNKYIVNTVLDESLFENYDINSGGHGKLKK